MNNKVYVIGIDGGTWKVINPLIKDGKLPFLKDLISGSAYGSLLSPIPALSAPSWASFQTGVNPGKHGVYDFVRYSDKGMSMNDAHDVKAPNLWDYSNGFNKKCLVINMPLTYPPRIKNGIMISCFLTPPKSKFVYPYKYQKEVEKLEYQIDILTSDKYGELPSRDLNLREKKEYLDELVKISKKRVETFKHLSQKDNFDFSFLLFKEVDIAQHLFWGTSFLSQYFQYLDSCVKDIYDFVIKMKVGDFSFIVMSDHGFHKAPIYEFSPYSWLRKSNSIESTNNSRKWKLLSEINKQIKKTGVKLTDLKKFDALRANLLKDSKKEFIDNYQFIVTPHGIYDFGGLEKLTDKEDLIKEFRKLRYRGIKVFKKIYRSNNVYKGSYVKGSPDIIWITNERFVVDTNVHTEQIFKKRINVLRGEHSSDRSGMYIINDKFVNVGKSETQDIFDITKLIYKKLDIEPPWFLDGKIPTCVTEDIDVNYMNQLNKKLQLEIDNLKK